MKRTFLYLVVVFCLAFPILGAQAQSVSHEEEFVRNAYAKVSFMSSLPPLVDAGIMQVSNIQITPENLANRVS